MCLLYLIKQHHGIRFPPDSLSQLTALIITHISRRRSDQTTDRMTLLILAHVDSRHHILVIEKKLRQGLCQLCLSHTGSTHEKE